MKKSILISLIITSMFLSGCSNGGKKESSPVPDTSTSESEHSESQSSEPAQLFTLSFDANGGTGEMDPMQFAEDSRIKLPAMAFTYAEHSFEGWALSALGEVEYEDEAGFVVPDHDVTLFAKWAEVQKHTLTFDGNGGAGSMEPLTKAVGSEFALPANSFTYYRHSFVGWALSEEGEVAYANEASFTMPDEDTTLYAIWEIESGYLEVTFDAGEGEFANGKKIEKQIRLQGGAFDVYYFAPTAKYNNKVSIGWALNGQEVYSVILNEAYTFTAIYEEYDVEQLAAELVFDYSALSTNGNSLDLSFTISAGIEQVAQIDWGDNSELTEISRTDNSSRYDVRVSHDYSEFTSSSEAVTVKIYGWINDLYCPQGEGAYTAKASLVSVKTYDSITRIPYSAFRNFMLLKSFENTNVRLIEAYAFAGTWESSTDTTTMNPIESFDFSHVVSIGQRAFSYSSLKEVNLPKTITEIGNCAFDHSYDLLTATFASDCPMKILNETFIGCTSLKSLQLPNTVEELNNVCQGCNALETVNIPETVKIIGSYCFNRCNLHTLELPNGLEEIGYSAFAGLKATSLYIPLSVKVIYSFAFTGSNIANCVVIPNGVKTMGECVFSDGNSDSLRLAVPFSSDNVPEGFNEKWNYATRIGSSTETLNTLYDYKIFIRSTEGQTLRVPARSLAVLVYYYNPSDKSTEILVRRGNDVTATIQIGLLKMDGSTQSATNTLTYNLGKPLARGYLVIAIMNSAGTVPATIGFLVRYS